MYTTSGYKKLYQLSKICENFTFNLGATFHEVSQKRVEQRKDEREGESGKKREKKKEEGKK